jgi:hypothetical protein
VGQVSACHQLPSRCLLCMLIAQWLAPAASYSNMNGLPPPAWRSPSLAAMIAHKKGHNPFLEGGEPSPPSHIKAVFGTTADREFYGPMAGARAARERAVCIARGWHARRGHAVRQKLLGLRKYGG